MNVLKIPELFEFIVPGRPQSWGVITLVRGKHAALTLNAKSKEYQKRIATAAHKAARGGKITVPVEVEYTFVFPRLKKHKAPGRHRHVVMPDLDRLLRNANDGMTRDRACKQKPARLPAAEWGGFLLDDSLVCGIRATKWYAAEGEAAHTKIVLRPVEI